MRESEDVGGYSWGFAAFFEVVGCRGGGGSFGPGEGERVVGPEADWWEGEEDVLAWFEGHGTGKADGYAHGVAGEGSDFGVGAGAA